MTAERVKPISPREVAGKKVFPDEVISSFNELIAQNGGDGCDPVIVNQDEVIKLMVSKGLNKDKIFKNHWLDVEGVYGKAGWRVGYDQPGYNETPYSPYFTFSRKRRS